MVHPRLATPLLLICSLGAAAAAASRPAPASPPSRPVASTGEYMRWAVTYMGVVGGYAEAWTEPDGEGRQVTTGMARNAPWFARVYTIDDRIRSIWKPTGGSIAYDTWFREGRFQQDQQMRFGTDGIHVERRQRGDTGWRSWSDAYPAHPGVEDPVSAFFRLRMLDLDQTQRIPVFSGRHTWTLEVLHRRMERRRDTPLGTVDTRIVELRTAHEGDLEQRGRFLLWVTDDRRQIPVRMVVRTNLGSIRADLVEYVPSGSRRAEDSDEPG